ncbi:MAG: TauD/TfdA family dioxygenase [Acidiferrobacterales bacterium]|nr:TauD/TfdA family dioxygenase [Acidiferrobacterales bacterium]
MTATAATEAIRVSPLSAVMAAEVTGVDLSGPISEELAAALNGAFLDHQVLCLRRQRLTPAEYVRATRIFGEPQAQIVKHFLHPGEPLISLVSSVDNRDKAGDGKPIVRGPYWHTDDSFLEVPAKATVLYAIEIPQDRGDTWFANMYAAYESLNDRIKARLNGLRAVHKYVSRRAGAKVAKLSAEDEKKTPDISHPLVRTHPETRRRSLYLNPNRIDHVEGLSLEESDALLDELYAHAFDERFHYRHRWRRGDLLLWDNRCTMHRASTDLEPGDRRLLHRILLKGTRPV